MDSDDMMYGSDEHKVSIYSSGQDPGLLPFSSGTVNSNTSGSGDGGDDGGGDGGGGGGGGGGKGNKPKKSKKTPIPVRV